MIPPAFAPTDKEHLLTSYQPMAGSWDEMIQPDGAPRPHWKAFIESMGALGGQDITRRWQHALQLIHENGVTYNVYGDPNGLDRPWRLDPIPFILPAEEWRSIESGLIQRAHLLERILGDLNGPQHLVAEGHLPAALLYANPSFLRPIRHLPVPGGRYLHFYAADIARRPDGSWMVISDRTQAPSGVGYALENRLVLSRAIPEAFHACSVRRLTAFSTQLNQALAEAVPRPREHAGIVLLTPGPYNETYFEHAYLARFLGCTLVEGEDLTVRDNTVYMKTLSGLRRVDVILRRLDEDFCDPLELRADSALGVAGLLGAVAAGNVTLVNAIGSGLAETPALHSFLPYLSRHLLGEDLRLPSATTWWCCTKEGREQVLANLDGLRLTHAFGRRQTALFPEGPADTINPDKLRRDMEHRPCDFAAVEPIAHSRTPVLSNDGNFESRAAVLRVFLIPDGTGYAVLPGGLTRVDAGGGTLSMQHGAGSKDTWIVDASAYDEPTLASIQSRPRRLRRGTNDLSSRVADNLYWLGRYTERFESVVRLFRTVLQRLADESAMRSMPGLARLLRVPASLGYIKLELDEDDHLDVTSFDDIEEELLAAIFQERRPGGLRDTLTCLHRLASGSRDRMSPDIWRILNHLYHDMAHPERQRGVQLGETVGLLNQMLLTLAAFAGIEMENMTRALDWRFLNMGRRLERAVNSIRLFQETLVDGADETDVLFEALLDVHDSAITYRSRYYASVDVAGVIDLLLIDESNPRSIGFQLKMLAEHMEHLPGDADLTLLTEERRILLAAQSELRLADACELSESVNGERPRLRALLDSLATRMPMFSDCMTRNYFSHARATIEANPSPMDA